MSNGSEEQAYMAMIAALRDFSEAVLAAQRTMQNAVEDCRDNMDQDGHAMERTEQISECYPVLRKAAEDANELAAKIKAEWDKIVNA